MMNFIKLIYFLNIVVAVFTYTLIEKFENKITGEIYKGSDNPDVYLTTTQIIARHGYPAESHVIQTKDGFLLTLHRIRYSKNNSSTASRPVVFLQHGLLGSSADWVLQGNNSLAFLLSDAGYDVWLGNARGNRYSRGHVKYTPKQEEFWNFSFHDMGTIDLPAVFDFIAKLSDEIGNITYIGHSMGTTMFFVYSSTQKEAADTVKMMVALAPVAFMAHVKSPVKYLAPWANDIQWLAKYLGLNEFLPNNKIVKYLAEIGCDKNTEEMNLCEDIIFLFCGFDKAEFNRDILLSVLYHEPAGTSTKTVIHYAQEIKSGGNFCEFDYGSKENIKRYGTEIPPNYNITNIKVPIYLMSADNDWLACPQDVTKLANLLPNKIGQYVVPMKEFNHIDFLFGKDDVKLVYKPLIQVINKYRSN